MKSIRCSARSLYVLLLLLVAVGISGCATSDSEDLSERPWNSPKNWETGLPSNMNEGH